MERDVYLFLLAVMVLIALTGTYLAYTNRLVLAAHGAASEQRSELSRKLITVQEEVLWSISRELHDEFGQILTAAGRDAPPRGEAEHPAAGEGRPG